MQNGHGIPKNAMEVLRAILYNKATLANMTRAQAKLWFQGLGFGSVSEENFSVINKKLEHLIGAQNELTKRN